MDFTGEHIVVTGGTGTLGKAVVAGVLLHGGICHIPAHGDRGLDDFPFADHDRVRLAGGVDLADEIHVARFYGDLPLLAASIHLAGGFAGARIEQTSAADFRRQIELNAATCFLCCRAAVQAMRKRGGGRIVNVAARPALEPRLGQGMVAYTAAKAAVAAITQALAQEVAKDGILVNAVVPSTIDTPANRAAMPKADHASWPTTEEIAATILFLASRDNRVTRGALVPVYGRS